MKKFPEVDKEPVELDKRDSLSKTAEEIKKYRESVILDKFEILLEQNKKDINQKFAPKFLEMLRDE
jgi:hypothetical protein